MIKQTLILHPHIKASLKNLNLDLDSELNRYEQYLDSLTHQSVKTAAEAIPALELPINLTPNRDNYFPKTLPTLVYESAIVNTELEETETIPVASRIVPEDKSLLDSLLTPWGIFGLIFFFTANGLIFVQQDFAPQSTINSITNNHTLVDNSNLDQPKSNQLETTDSNQSNQQVNQLSLPPSLPSPLPTIETTEVNQTNQPINLYSDLKTALLSEAKNYQVELPPPVYPTTDAPSSSAVVIDQHSLPLPSSPNQTTSASKTASKSQLSTKYYVVTEYQNMENYKKVKGIISEAFIVNINNEMKIQLGVFDEQVGAEKYDQQMKKQGLPSKIIPVSHSQKTP
jgi:hypothetical protein